MTSETTNRPPVGQKSKKRSSPKQLGGKNFVSPALREREPLKISAVRAWAMWASVALFYCFQFVVRVSPNVMAVDLMGAFAVSAGALGMLSSFYYWVYAPLQLPLGALMDRFGPRRMATTAILLCTGGVLLFAWTSSLTIAILGRMMMGAGSACAFLSCMKVATLWFPSKHLAMVVGLTMMLGTAGASSAGGPLYALVEIIGWRDTLFYLTYLGGILALVVWLLVRDREDQNQENAQKPTLAEGIVEVISKPQSWFAACYSFLLYTPLSVFGDLWSVTYLSQRYGVNCNEVATAGSMMYIGLIFGSPIFGWLTDFLKSRKKPMMITAISTFVIFSLILYVPAIPLNIMYGLLFLSGFMLGGQFICFAVACELNRPVISGTAVGFTNMVCMISGMLFQPLVGKILDFFWDGKLMAGAMPQYSIQSFQLGLSVIPLCAAAATILLMFIRETYQSENN